MNELPEPGQSRDLMIRGPAGLIEATLARPRAERAPPVLAIVCHPHPLFGGAMSNKVTWALASCAQKAGATALRFNFRGVGRSQGRHDEGRGETDDVVWLADWYRQQVPGAGLLLLGFSFGSWVAQHAAARLQPAALVSIAPPLAKYFEAHPPPPPPECPWLVMHSRDDEVVEYGPTKALLDASPRPPQLVTVDGAGHFFHGRLGDIEQAVLPFLEQQLAR
ncbi:MAG TPA: alpha/beta fold hydrolase [Solimonas sp.]|nr:alpha/beta fold hydrolase [Solimonas sp.]